MNFEITSPNRRCSRKKAFGHGRFGGDGAWKQHARRHIDDWESEGRKAKQLRRSPLMVDASEALAEARAEIRDREMADLLATRTVVAASYDSRRGLRIYCERATAPCVTRVSTPVATTATKAKRRHRGGRKHRNNNRQRLAIAA